MRLDAFAATCGTPTLLIGRKVFVLTSRVGALILTIHIHDTWGTLKIYIF